MGAVFASQRISGAAVFGDSFASSGASTLAGDIAVDDLVALGGFTSGASALSGGLTLGNSFASGLMTGVIGNIDFVQKNPRIHMEEKRQRVWVERVHKSRAPS